MTQLVYQPSFDPYNTAFRLLRLREGITLEKPTPFDCIRVLDFFLLFPFLIGAVKLKQKNRGFRKLSQGYDHMQPYARMPEGNQLLERMRPFQIAAAKSLVASELLDLKMWNKGTFIKSDVPLAPKLNDAISEINKEQSDLLNMLTEFANSYPFSGSDGLKARSGLLEFRYDTI